MAIKVAVAQFTAGLDTDENARQCAELVATSAGEGADLAVLPEASMFFDPAKEQADRPHGQTLDGEFVAAVAEAAKAHGIAVLVGLSESLPGRRDDKRDSNTVVVVSATGETLGAYRKIHLYDAFGYRESEQIRPGEIGQPLVFQVGDISVGVLTCYDLRFPEAFRWVTDAGADLIAVPAAWAVGPAKEDHWRTLVRARAIENTIYVAAAGQTGPPSCGQSIVVDPMGVELANAGERPGVAVASVSQQRLEQVRQVNPSLRNRRFKVLPR